MDAEQSKVRQMLLGMKAQAINSFGLTLNHDLVRDIDHLLVCWNPSLFRRVQMAMENLQIARETIPTHLADRIPPDGTFKGELSLAFAVKPDLSTTEVLIPAAQLLPGTIIAGLPGSGKTHLVRRLLRQIVSKLPHVRIVIFDPNRSYERTCADPKLWLSIPWDMTRIGIYNPPPGYSDTKWITEKTDLVSRGELMNSKYLVCTRADELHAKAMECVAAGERYLPFSFVDLRDNLRDKRCRPGSREQGYLEAALNVIDGRVRTTPKVYDCSAGMEALISNSRARVSTEGLAPLESLEFYVTNLIHYLYRRRCTEPLIEPPTLHAFIVVEEAQTLIERHSQAAIRFYEEILLRSRALGISIVFIAQDLARIDSTIGAACPNIFLFCQGTGYDKRAANSVADLSERETAMLGELAVGECYCRFAGHPSFPYPFVAKVPA